MQTQSIKNAPLDMDKWRDIINDWKQSGENQKSYCDRLEISLNAFSYARAKLLQKEKSKTHFVPATVHSQLMREKVLMGYAHW